MKKQTLLKFINSNIANTTKEKNIFQKLFRKLPETSMLRKIKKLIENEIRIDLNGNFMPEAEENLYQQIHNIALTIPADEAAFKYIEALEIFFIKEKIARESEKAIIVEDNKTHNAEFSPFNRLSDEMMVAIFSFFTQREIKLNLEPVCQHFRSMALDAYFLRKAVPSYLFKKPPYKKWQRVNVGVSAMSFSGLIAIAPISSGEISLHTHDGEVTILSREPVKNYSALSFSPDGSYLIASSRNSESVDIWDVKEEKLLNTYSILITRKAIGDSHVSAHVIALSKGRMICAREAVSGAEMHAVYDMKSGECITRFETKGIPFQWVDRISSNEKYILLTSSVPHQKARLYDIESGKLVKTFSLGREFHFLGQSQNSIIAYSRNITEGGSVTVLDLLTEKHQHTLIENNQALSTRPPAISPDGNYIAILEYDGLSKGKVKIYNINHNKAKPLNEFDVTCIPSLQPSLFFSPQNEIVYINHNTIHRVRFPTIADEIIKQEKSTEYAYASSKPCA